MKERERAVKLKVYCTTRDRIFEKRAKGELDNEMLVLTSKLLVKNPDVYTFWNIRRDTIEKMSEKKADESEEEHAKRKEGLLAMELPLTEDCLMENPKSYGAWFQRGWALERMSNRDIDRELKMCEKALQMDGRNFHCWDYRRFVSKLANLPPEEELEFSNRLINTNFSNYSAWHYRSTLLPRVHPDPNGVLLISDETVARELEKVANAFFTDPEDQSAWIYTEWLLGLWSAGADGSIMGKNKVAVVSLTFDTSKETAFVVMSAAVSAEELTDFISFPSMSEQELTWIAVSVFRLAKYARVFRVEGHGQFMEARIRPTDEADFITVDPAKGFVNKEILYRIYDIEKPKQSESREKALISVMKNCKSLIDELASDGDKQINKWPLLTYNLCLMELDPITHHEEILASLSKLANELDPQRGTLYSDLAAKQRVNAVLRSKHEKGERWIDVIVSSSDSRPSMLDLRCLQLRSLEHLEFLGGFITDLCVSDNAISDVRTLAVLPRLVYLMLDENPIKSLNEFPSLQRLEFLSAASTQLQTMNDVSEVLSLKNLDRFLFCETPLAKNDEESRKLYDTVAKTSNNLRLFRYYM